MPRCFWSREPGSPLRVRAGRVGGRRRIRSRNIAPPGLDVTSPVGGGQGENRMTDSTTTPRRGIRTIALLAAAAVVTVLTLAPRAIVAPARGEFLQFVDRFSPLLAWLHAGDAERVLNTLLFIPLGAAVALLLPRRGWPLAVVAAGAASAGVEYLQTSIPGRVPDLDDVLWNTAGGAIGAIAVTVVRLVIAVARRAGQRGSVTRT